MGKVGVVVATYGDYETWGQMARRAMRSVELQTVAPAQIVWAHHESLQEARNAGSSHLTTEWCIFLDADDELDGHYIEAMLAADGDIRRPATLGVYQDGSEDEAAVLIPRRDLRTSNYIVIGAMHRRELFQEVGGFRDYSSLEDWDLWRRMVAQGAEVGDVPAAIYRIHVRDGSRNADQVQHGRNYDRIYRDGVL